MPWDRIMANWPSVTAKLLRDFPHLDPARVDRFGQDRDHLIQHLAQAHDLTITEAKEVLTEWQNRIRVMHLQTAA